MAGIGGRATQLPLRYSPATQDVGERFGLIVVTFTIDPSFAYVVHSPAWTPFLNEPERISDPSFRNHSQ
jgi:hypothetical protein